MCLVWTEFTQKQLIYAVFFMDKSRRTNVIDVSEVDDTFSSH